VDLACGPNFTVSFERAGASGLMMGEAVESFQGIGGGKIHATAGAVKACSTAFGAFIHQGWTGYRTGW